MSKITLNRKVSFKVLLPVIFLSILLASSLTYVFVYATLPTVIIGPGMNISEASYIFFKDGSTYYVRNGYSGTLTSSSNFATLTQLTISLASAGSKLFFRNGGYSSTATINITKVLVIQGESAAYTVISFADGKHGFEVTPGVNQLEFHDITIESGTHLKTKLGISLETNSFLLFDNINMYGWDIALDVYDCTDSIVQNSRFWFNTIDLNLYHECVDWDLINNEFSGNDYTTGAGLRCDGDGSFFEGIQATNCLFFGHYYGVYLTEQANYVKLYECTMQDKIGVYANNCLDLTISGCYFGSNTANGIGIYTAGCNFQKISDNYFNYPLYQIQVVNAYECIISDNNFVGTVGPSVVHINSTNFRLSTITGNVFHNASGTTHAFYLMGTNDYWMDGTVIVGNRFGSLILKVNTVAGKEPVIEANDEEHLVT